jgi:uncharacterized protein YhbP (UPF0306 family)
MKDEERIINFINEHHVLTLAVSNNNIPYCANCFYAFDSEKMQLIFTSDETTRHIKDIENNDIVGGSIVLETKTVGKIQGIQFNGYIKKLKDTEYKTANKLYLKRFPYAVLAKTTLWAVDLKFIKLTDNRLGFGKKIIWGKEIV